MYMNDMIANMSSMISGACMGTGVIRFKLVSSLRVRMMMLNVLVIFTIMIFNVKQRFQLYSIVFNTIELYSTNRTLFSVLAICFLI